MHLEASFLFSAEGAMQAIGEKVIIKDNQSQTLQTTTMTDVTR